MSGAKIDFAALLEPVARKLWGEPNPALSSNAELRWGTHGSRSADLKERVWFDHEANEGGGTLDLIKREKGFNGRNAVDWLVAEGLVSKPNGAAAKIIATYSYVDENEILLFQVCRYDPKGFKQRRQNGKGWIWKLGDTRRILYNLPRLREAVACEQIVLVVEGEKDVENLRRLNITATCNPEGAGKWRAEFNEALRGADVVLIPDNDAAGYAHINMVGAALTGIARRIRVLLLPGLPDKGDASDWIAAGGTAEQIWALIEQAPDWQPLADTPSNGADPADPKADEAKKAAEEREQQLFDELATLSRADYDRRRTEAASELGLRRGTLDDEVEARRAALAANSAPAPLFGHWIVEPWPEPVEADALLNAIVRRFQRHLVLNAQSLLTMPLWVLMAWVHHVAVHSPILWFTSPEANSGKTTGLELVIFTVPRGLPSVGISEAALFRSIEMYEPTIGIDEADTILVDNEPLRAVINSGWTRGSGVLRCVGDGNTPHLFPTFTPIVMASKGLKFPDTTLSRGIIIRMERRKKSEGVERFRSMDDVELADLRRQAMRWAADNAEALEQAAPKMPPGFDNRLGDNWHLMFAVADLAGGEYPEKAREAAAAISQTGEDHSIGVKLLTDIKAAFAAADQLPSGTIVEALVAMEGRPWADWKGGFTKNKLARLLAPFGVVSGTVRVSEHLTAKGYKLAHFRDAFERYLGDES